MSKTTLWRKLLGRKPLSKQGNSGGNSGSLVYSTLGLGPVNIPMGASQAPPQDMPETCVELRWVITSDLDGPQLQYRAWKMPGAKGFSTTGYSDWKPIPFKFVGKKLDNPGETDGKNKWDPDTTTKD